MSLAVVVALVRCALAFAFSGSAYASLSLSIPIGGRRSAGTSARVLLGGGRRIGSRLSGGRTTIRSRLVTDAVVHADQLHPVETCVGTAERNIIRATSEITGNLSNFSSRLKVLVKLGHTVEGKVPVAEVLDTLREELALCAEGKAISPDDNDTIQICGRTDGVISIRNFVDRMWGRHLHLFSE